MKKRPLVSVVIVNYNGKKYLLKCLKGVFANQYLNYEVIAVDNGSTDGSVAEAMKRYGRKKNFIALGLKKNYGPAYARNRGAAKAKGKYLAFLDNDTLPEKDWLIPLVAVMEKDPSIGACQCKLLLVKDRRKFDYAGDYLSQFGFLVQRVEGGEIDRGQADQKVEILSAKSAAMIINREAFKKAGGFDKDYFIFLEETDLGWRTWLAGYRIIFVPESKVYHEFGTTSLIAPSLQNYNLRFHGTKNYITTNFKNLETINLIKILPIHIFLWLGIGIWLLVKRQFQNGFYVLKGVIWPFFNLGKLIKKRTKIQRRRKVSDNEIFPKIFRRISFKYFYDKLTGVHKIGHAKSYYYEKGN